MPHSNRIPDHRAARYSPPTHSAAAPLADARTPADFLSEASRLLAESFLHSTLSTAASLALPLLGTWCMADAVDHEGAMRRMFVLHPDVELQERARRHFNRRVLREGEAIGVGRMMSTTSMHLAVIDGDEVLAEIPETEARLLRQLGARSFLVIGLRTNGQTVGAMTFGSNVPRDYDAVDLVLADDLGRRCAATIDSAWSYGETQIARVRAEHAFAMEDAARAEFAYAVERGDRAFEA
jgi:hypothetical protein